jgi:DNA-binding CsgD family transcriptional regulator
MVNTSEHQELLPTAHETQIPVLDLFDPIDSILNQYVNAVTEDQLITDRAQRFLVRSAKRKEAGAAGTLLRTHRGLIASVAFQFKGQGVTSEELLLMGGETLLATALSHKIHDPESFSDQAILAMEAKFEEAAGPKTTYDIATQDMLPMDRILHFVRGFEYIDVTRPLATIGPASTPLIERLAGKLSIAKRAQAVRDIAKLKPAGRAALAILHLPTDEIARSQDLKPNSLGRVIEDIRTTLGVNNRLGAALVALEAGVEFEVLPSPPLDALTIRQRQIAYRRNKSNKGIAVELGITESQVAYAMKPLYAIT